TNGASADGFRFAPGVRRRQLALPQFLRGHEAGADQRAIAPDPLANAQDVTRRTEGNAKQVGDEQVADVDTDPALRNVDHLALDPRRIRRRNHISRLLKGDTHVTALAEIVGFPHHGTSEDAWKALNVGY